MRQPTRAFQGFEKFHVNTHKLWFLYKMQRGVRCRELVALVQYSSTTPNYKACCKVLPKNLCHLYVSCALVNSILSKNY